MGFIHAEPCCIYSFSFFFLPTADFGDFNRYDSQEFLQKFVLFPIVSIFIFNGPLVKWKMLQLSCAHLCLTPALYQSWLCLCRTGSRMSECWKRPLRKWLFFISPSGEQVLKALACLFCVWINRPTALHIAQETTIVLRLSVIFIMSSSGITKNLSYILYILWFTLEQA